LPKADSVADNIIKDIKHVFGGKQGKPKEELASREKNREVLTKFLSANAPHLMNCVEPMLDHKRWVEAVAISYQETQYCTVGVGASPKNNCGGITSLLKGRPNGRFASYANKCDGLEQIAYLIERGRYANWTIDQMNGTYCINESNFNYGGKCPYWEENIMRVVNEIRDLY
jgi:hypothetical protein